MIDALISIFLHLDQNLPLITQEYGMWTYLILFFIIFFETGFIIFPFLPGDSLLFVGGAAAASGILDPWWLLIAVILGAVIGDTVNYWVANRLGLRIFLERFPTLVKQEHIDRTYAFYEKYGGATIVIARFVPLVRTFAPFLAGIGSMQYRKFLFYNILGAICWAASIILLGYFAGTLTIVKQNMSLLFLGVALLMGGTILLIAASIIKGYFMQKKSRSS